MSKAKEWRIVGGKETGGLLVRDEDGIQYDYRLPHGAVVTEQEKKGDKLKYMIMGPGYGAAPREGWISVKIKNKVLAEPADAAGYPGPGAKAAPKAPAAPPTAKEAASAAEVYGLVDGGSAWGQWKPMPESAWSKWPRAGGGDKPKNPKAFKERQFDVEVGEFWGIKFPINRHMFEEWGPSWLTEAMHTAGTLPKDNEITEFTEFKVVGEDVADTSSVGGASTDWGGAGPKVLLSVKYKNGPGELGEGMFVKFPHTHAPNNERIKLSVNGAVPSGWSENMFYNSIGGRMPFRTPRGYFAEMSRRTTNYILITERIPYGSKDKTDFAPGDILPAPPKYRDWAIKDVADHYYAHAKSMAQFFAWSREINRSTNQVNQMFNEQQMLDFQSGVQKEMANLKWADRDKGFAKMISAPPLNAVVPGMGFAKPIALGMLEMGKDMLTVRAPHVFPAELSAKSHVDKFMKEATEMAGYCAEMSFYQVIHPEYTALAHPNAQVDNAFYWRDEAGTMQSGILDWDGAQNMPMPTCLGNAWMGSESDTFDEHEEKLVVYFLDEYKKASGEELDKDTFYMCLKLAQASVMYGCFSNLGVLHRLVKADEWKDIKDRYDPKVDGQFLTRCYYVQVELFLAMFKNRSPYPFFQKFMKRTSLPKK
mmetsp:Transcript_41747/g.73422  ORF Transcript_41747/g.73422 Transcript_41747/m.73422 type:complete len:649 (+) Transcript_41747:22-1968(+)